MAFVLGAVAAIFLLVLLIAAITGHLRTGSCCTVADPANDLRMRAAFEDDERC